MPSAALTETLQNGEDRRSAVRRAPWFPRRPCASRGPGRRGPGARLGAAVSPAPGRARRKAGRGPTAEESHTSMLQIRERPAYRSPRRSTARWLRLGREGSCRPRRPHQRHCRLKPDDPGALQERPFHPDRPLTAPRRFLRPALNGQPSRPNAHISACRRVPKNQTELCNRF